MNVDPEFEKLLALPSRDREQIVAAMRKWQSAYRTRLMLTWGLTIAATAIYITSIGGVKISSSDGGFLVMLVIILFTPQPGGTAHQGLLYPLVHGLSYLIPILPKMAPLDHDDTFRFYRFEAKKTADGYRYVNVSKSPGFLVAAFLMVFALPTGVWAALNHFLFKFGTFEGVEVLHIPPFNSYFLGFYIGLYLFIYLGIIWRFWGFCYWNHVEPLIPLLQAGEKQIERSDDFPSGPPLSG